MSRCVLCASEALNHLCDSSLRSYWRCEACQLIQVPRRYHLAPEQEKQHYDTHENLPQDGRYRDFLNRLCEPLSQRLVSSSSGLDFGSGPGPTLSLLMQERGHQVRNYDPFYVPDKSALAHKYDFITLTEVIEHLQSPLPELERLWACLNKGGYLAIMTQMTDQLTDFCNWYYQRDPTHICFWSRATMHWLADHLVGAQLSFPGKNLSFLKKT